MKILPGLSKFHSHSQLSGLNLPAANTMSEVESRFGNRSVGKWFFDVLTEIERGDTFFETTSEMGLREVLGIQSIEVNQSSDDTMSEDDINISEFRSFRDGEGVTKGIFARGVSGCGNKEEIIFRFSMANNSDFDLADIYLSDFKSPFDLLIQESGLGLSMSLPIDNWEGAGDLPVLFRGRKLDSKLHRAAVEANVLLKFDESGDPRSAEGQPRNRDLTESETQISKEETPEILLPDSNEWRDPSCDSKAVPEGVFISETYDEQEIEPPPARRDFGAMEGLQDAAEDGFSVRPMSEAEKVTSLLREDGQAKENGRRSVRSADVRFPKGRAVYPWALRSDVGGDVGLSVGDGSGEGAEATRSLASEPDNGSTASSARDFWEKGIALPAKSDASDVGGKTAQPLGTEKNYTLRPGGWTEPTVKGHEARPILASGDVAPPQAKRDVWTGPNSDAGFPMITDRGVGDQRSAIDGEVILPAASAATSVVATSIGPIRQPLERGLVVPRTSTEVQQPSGRPGGTHGESHAVVLPHSVDGETGDLRLRRTAITDRLALRQAPVGNEEQNDSAGRIEIGTEGTHRGVSEPLPSRPSPQAEKTDQFRFPQNLVPASGPEQKSVRPHAQGNSQDLSRATMDRENLSSADTLSNLQRSDGTLATSYKPLPFAPADGQHQSADASDDDTALWRATARRRLGPEPNRRSELEGGRVRSAQTEAIYVSKPAPSKPQKDQLGARGQTRVSIAGNAEDDEKLVKALSFKENSRGPEALPTQAHHVPAQPSPVLRPTPHKEAEKPEGAIRVRSAAAIPPNSDRQAQARVMPSEPLAGELFASSTVEGAVERSEVSGGIASAPVQAEPREMVFKEGLPAPKTQPQIRQLAEAIIGAEDGQVELQLEPEELGRVNFNVKHSDQGVTLHITADRPETLELLRRHAEQLARYLQEHGYQSSSFSFAGGRSGRQSAPQKLRDAGPRLASVEANPSVTLAGGSQRRASDGLDLRL